MIAKNVYAQLQIETCIENQHRKITLMHLIGYLSLFPFSFYIHMTSSKNNKTLNAFSHGKNDGSATFFSSLALSFVRCTFANIFRFSTAQNVRFAHCSPAIRRLFSMVFSWNFLPIFFSFSYRWTNIKFLSLFALFACNLCTIHTFSHASRFHSIHFNFSKVFFSHIRFWHSNLFAAQDYLSAWNNKFTMMYKCIKSCTTFIPFGHVTCKTTTSHPRLSSSLFKCRRAKRRASSAVYCVPSTKWHSPKNWLIRAINISDKIGISLFHVVD